MITPQHLHPTHFVDLASGPDAAEALCPQLKAGFGYERIVLGNIYKGGCTLATYADYFTNNTAGYT